jgi:hypothetical protein
MADDQTFTQSALNRLESQAASQGESASTALAMAPYEYESTPGTIKSTDQELHPSAMRLATPKWAGYTSTLNRAQASQDQADVWVTVPVDKVVASQGSHAIAPVYATTQGYKSRPGESTGSIPPSVGAGR